MIKQLLLVVQGEFHDIEFKNMVTDRVAWFNLQTKEADAPDVRSKTRLDAEDTISILLEGREEDLEYLGAIFARGPLTAHIVHTTWTYRDAPKQATPKGNPPAQGTPHKRRRRRRNRGRNL